MSTIGLYNFNESLRHNHLMLCCCS